MGYDKVFKSCKYKLCKQNDQRCEYRALVKARAAAKSDYCGHPKTCRRGKSLYLSALGYDDGSRTDKADARDDLRAETRHIRVKPEIKHEVHDYVSRLHSGKDEAFNREYEAAHDHYFALLKSEEAGA